MSSVLVHALRELRAIHMDAEDSERVVKIINLIEECSPAVSTDLIGKIMDSELLTPISNKTEEWVFLGDGTWQNLRNPDLYSTTKGNTYWDVTETVKGAREPRLHTSMYMEN